MSLSDQQLSDAFSWMPFIVAAELADVSGPHPGRFTEP